MVSTPLVLMLSHATRDTAMDFLLNPVKNTITAKALFHHLISDANFQEFLHLSRSVVFHMTSIVSLPCILSTYSNRCGVSQFEDDRKWWILDVYAGGVL